MPVATCTPSASRSTAMTRVDSSAAFSVDAVVDGAGAAVEAGDHGDVVDMRRRPVAYSHTDRCRPA